MANTKVLLAILCLGASLAATGASGYVQKNVYSLELQPDALAGQFSALEDWLVEHIKTERKGTDLSSILKEIRKNLKKTTHDTQAHRAAQLLQDSSDGITNPRCSHIDFENLRHLYYGIFAKSTMKTDGVDDEMPFKSILEKAVGGPLKKFVSVCPEPAYDASLKKGAEMEMGIEQLPIIERAVNRFQMNFQRDIPRLHNSIMSYEKCNLCSPLDDEESFEHLAKVVQRYLPSSDINDQTYKEAYNESIYKDCQLILDAYSNVFDVHSKAARMADPPSELIFVETKTMDYKMRLFQFQYCRAIVDKRSEIIGKIREMSA